MRVLSMTLIRPDRPLLADHPESGREPDETVALRSPLMALAEALPHRANSLETRLRNPVSATVDPADGEVVKTRWAAWREEAAGGSDDLMVRRLAWDGVTEDEALRGVSDHGPEAAPGDVDWILLLQRIGTPDESCLMGCVVEPAIIASEGIPFAPAYGPFLLAAVAPLSSDLDHAAGRLDPALVADLLGGLLADLARLGGRVLATAFGDFLRMRSAAADPDETADHEAFEAGLGAASGWEPVLQAHPVLARLLATSCLGWRADTAKFLARLQADWDALPPVFFPAATTGHGPRRLSRLRSSSSDRHEGACAVRILEFSDGTRVVYKARPLNLEADFHDLLRALAARGLAEAPPALLVLARRGYGWVEFAEAAPVTDRPALDAWFRRAGALLCLMHLLGGNDGHMENIIATAAGPVLIDVETLLQPRRPPAEQEATGTFAQAARQVHDSVLQTGLLPLWQQGRQGRPYDIGGFTGTGGYESPVLHQSWEHIGTNAVRPTWRRAVARGLRNLPVFDGSRHAAGAHLPALTAGFSAAWQFLQSNRDLLDAALPRWAEAPLRVLIRPTTHYAALLERSLTVDALKSGVDRSIIFEGLRRPMVRQFTTRPAYWPAVAEEIRALEAGDIPIFYVQAGGRDLAAADGRCLVPGAFGESALTSTAARLDRLTDANRLRQLELIAAAFIESSAETSPPPPVEATATPVDIDTLLATTPLASDASLIATADILANQIISAAVRGRDGFVTWVGPSSLHPGQRRQQGGSYYLYDGAAGIALFLAAHARVTGHKTARSTALAALEPIRAILDSPDADSMIRREGIGGCSGLGSLIYALTTIAGLLDTPTLIDTAAHLGRFIGDARIAADQALDIVSGSAGAIMGLLALHRAGGGDEALQRAVACGRHLLAHAEPVGTDGLAWPSWPDRLLLAGYSHGAAGCAAALLSLFKATGDQAFAEAARAALRYERSLFEPAAGNWPILLPSGDVRFASTWCHGAPGILLSRPGFLGVFGDNEDTRLREEMAIAAHTTVTAGVSSLDHLCCGTMGRVEILHTVAPTLGDRMRDLARLGATLTLQRARHRRAFSLQTDPVRNAVFQPGFFRGLSGIGYSCLRLARPDLLPAVLAWQNSPSPLA